MRGNGKISVAANISEAPKLCQLDRRQHSTPILRLSVAILESAICDYRRRTLRSEVRAWVTDDDPDGVFSLAAICGRTGIDYDKARRGLLAEFEQIDSGRARSLRISLRALKRRA